MRSLARTSLGWLGLVLIAPMGVSAQYVPSPAPAGYQPAAPAAAPAGHQPAAPAAAPAPTYIVEAPHQHRWGRTCPACAAKQAGAMPPGKIVGCAHSRNGVCSACQAALNMPGQFVATSSQPVDASGRALASSSSNPAANVAQAYGNGMSDPAPVGVIQANYAPAAPMGAPPSYAPQASPPGRAVAESNANAGHDPYQLKDKNGGFPHPHILGHLFGWSGMGAERAEEKARKKSEAHAMITYDNNGTAPVDELPASMVFDKKQR